MAAGCSLPVELGFTEKVELWKLKSKFFPSKMGGKPAWLTLKDIPTTICTCGEPLMFFLQVYAPVEEHVFSFHRTLFVFVCPNCAKKNLPTAYTVWRSQLARVNNFYSSDPPSETKELADKPSASDYQMMCTACGSVAGVPCPHCSEIIYCSSQHQKKDWDKGHKHQCGKREQVTKAIKHRLVPEFEIVTETEEISGKPEHEDTVDDLRHFMKASHIKENNDFDGDLSAIEEMMKAKKDKAFKEFRKRTAEYPEQILRYCRNGEPLWVSAGGKPKSTPKCERCGGPRCFEFQIMPQILTYAKLDELDFGTLLVFTCKGSCDIGEGYVKEVIFRQDFSK